MATDFFGSEVWSGLGLVVSYLLSFIHFNYHPIPSVMTALCEPMLALRRRALDLSLRQRRWAYLVIQQSQAKQDGQSVLEQIRSEFEFADARQRHSQDKVKVIALSAARPRPIRDGPVQHRQRDDSRSQDKLRKAA
jgi:hypothetical protein